MRQSSKQWLFAGLLVAAGIGMVRLIGAPRIRKGVEQRAEYAHIDESKPGRAGTWGWADMNLKAQCYRELLRQYFTPRQLDMPVAEVPPAHAYYYSKTDPRTTGALLHKYGVKYVNGGINVSGLNWRGSTTHWRKRSAEYRAPTPSSGGPKLPCRPASFRPARLWQLMQLPSSRLAMIFKPCSAAA